MNNSGEDTEMIPAVNADNVESNVDPSDESAVVPTVITNAATASHCTGNVASEASLGNLQLENITPETKSSGTISGVTGPADKEVLSTGGQQQEKSVYICVCCISYLVFKQLHCAGSKGHSSSIEEVYSFWSSVRTTSFRKKAEYFSRVFK